MQKKEIELTNKENNNNEYNENDNITLNMKKKKRKINKNLFNKGKNNKYKINPEKKLLLKMIYFLKMINVIIYQKKFLQKIFLVP